MLQLLPYLLVLVLGAVATFFYLKQKVNRELSLLTQKLDKASFTISDPQGQRNELSDSSHTLLPELNSLKEKIISLTQNKSEAVPEKPKSDEWQEKAESIQKRFENLQVVNELGQLVTSSLKLEDTFSHLYKTINSMMDASIVELGVYYWKENRWEILSNLNAGKPASGSENNYKNHMAEWCLQNKREIFLDDAETDFARFVFKPLITSEGKPAQSVMSFPILQNEIERGTLTIISYRKNAFNNYHVEMLRSLLPYTAVALENSLIHQELIITQQQLIHNEKMASIGQLSSGIAHEIINPLNFVNNFSEMSIELLDEIREAHSTEEQEQLKNQLVNNLDKINFHGNRAYNIVKNMMALSRSGSGDPTVVNINKTIEEFLEIAYQGFKMKVKDFECRIETVLDAKLPTKKMVGEDFSRVLLNLFTNGLYAMNEKRKKLNHQSGENAMNVYEPMLIVKTALVNSRIVISVYDNGMGIPDEIKSKVFLPFFTTKPTGEGTGLGLSISHDIITKGNNGNLIVNSESGKGTEFKIELPIN